MTSQILNTFQTEKNKYNNDKKIVTKNKTERIRKMMSSNQNRKKNNVSLPIKCVRLATSSNERVQKLSDFNYYYFEWHNNFPYNIQKKAKKTSKHQPYLSYGIERLASVTTIPTITAIITLIVNNGNEKPEAWQGKKSIFDCV